MLFRSKSNIEQMDEAAKHNTLINDDFRGFEELKEEFKIGSVVEQDGKLLKVVEINNALPTTCFASFPSVTFEEVQKVSQSGTTR